MNNLCIVQCDFTADQGIITNKITFPDSRKSFEHTCDNSLDQTSSTWHKRIQGRLDSYKSPSSKGSLIHEEDQALANTLIDALIPDIARDSFEKVCTKANSRVVIEVRTNEPSIANIPWEVCAHTSWATIRVRKPEPSIVIVRTPKEVGDEVAFDNSGRLRILVAGSAPLSTSIVNFPKERRTIEDGLRAGLGNPPRSPLPVFDDMPETTLLKLESALKDFPHIVHFVGHGGKGLIELEDSQGSSRYVTGSDLAERLRSAKPPLQLIVTTSCLSMQYDEEINIASVGQSLVDYVPHVIGMQLIVTSQASLAFVRSIYAELAASQSVIDAYARARDELMVALPHSPEWIAPVIIQGRKTDGHLFRPPLAFADIIYSVIDQIDQYYDALREHARSPSALKGIKKMLSEIDRHLIRNSQLRNSLNVTHQDQLIEIETCTGLIDLEQLYLEDFQELSAKERIELEFPKHVSNLRSELLRLRALLSALPTRDLYA